MATIDVAVTNLNDAGLGGYLLIDFVGISHLKTLSIYPSEGGEPALLLAG